MVAMRSLPMKDSTDIIHNYSLYVDTIDMMHGIGYVYQGTKLSAPSRLSASSLKMETMGYYSSIGSVGS